jgi:hypothetical protein
MWKGSGSAGAAGAAGAAATAAGAGSSMRQCTQYVSPARAPVSQRQLAGGVPPLVSRYTPTSPARASAGGHAGRQGRYVLSRAGLSDIWWNTAVQLYSSTYQFIGTNNSVYAAVLSKVPPEVPKCQGVEGVVGGRIEELAAGPRRAGPHLAGSRRSPPASRPVPRPARTPARARRTPRPSRTPRAAATRPPRPGGRARGRACTLRSHFIPDSLRECGASLSETALRPGPTAAASTGAAGAAAGTPRDPVAAASSARSYGPGAPAAPRVIPDCHFRKTGTEYDRKPGIKWSICTEK